MMPSLLVEPTPEQLVLTTAENLVEAARADILARGVFSFALSGGSTPRVLYQTLADRKWRAQIDWKRTHVFFGDERAVPSNDEYSNYRMAREALLGHIPIPEENVHRMKGELEDLDAAARDYETELRAIFPLDVVLLGMGEDGHTASLFPRSPALEENEKLCVVTPVASLEPRVRRLTLTYPALNAARRVWLLAPGAGKAARLKEVFDGLQNGTSDVASTPITGVQPQGEYLWLLDKAAATQLRANSTSA
jgi:6-phosphogluconolactonase